MNALTLKIAGWLKVSVDDAAKVQDEMGVYWGIDFSEATYGELKSVAKLAHAEMKLHARI